MKNLLLILFLIFSLTTFAQDPVADEQKEVAEKETANRNVALSTHPIQLLIGATNLSADFKIMNSVTLGASILRWQATLPNEDEFKLTSAGIQAKYYAGGGAWAQGWYVGGSLQRMNIDLTTEIDDREYEGSVSASVIGLDFGYHWQWENFFQDFGGTLYAGSLADTITLKDENGDEEEYDTPGYGFSGFGLEYRIGLVF